MPRQTVHFNIRKGATFKHLFRFLDSAKEPVILSGATVHLQLRASVNGTLLLDLTEENDRLIVSPLDGEVEVVIPDDVTPTIAATTNGYWDLRVRYSNGEVEYPVEGTFSTVESGTDD